MKFKCIFPLVRNVAVVKMNVMFTYYGVTYNKLNYK